MQGKRYEQMRKESLREHGTPRPCSVQINRYYLEHLDGLFPRKHIFRQSGGLVASLVSAVWRPLMQCLYCPVLVTTLTPSCCCLQGQRTQNYFLFHGKLYSIVHSIYTPRYIALSSMVSSPSLQLNFKLE